jgi:hypothetical protein
LLNLRKLFRRPASQTNFGIPGRILGLVPVLALASASSEGGVSEVSGLVGDMGDIGDDGSSGWFFSSTIRLALPVAATAGHDNELLERVSLNSSREMVCPAPGAAVMDVPDVGVGARVGLLGRKSGWMMTLLLPTVVGVVGRDSNDGNDDGPECLEYAYVARADDDERGGLDRPCESMSSRDAAGLRVRFGPRMGPGCVLFFGTAPKEN